MSFSSRPRVKKYHRPMLESLEDRMAPAAWTPLGPGPAQDGQVEGLVNGEVVGAVQVLAPHPTNADILFVGATNGGIWRTTNATATSPNWTPLTDSQPSLSMGALEYDPTDGFNQTLLAGFGRFSSFGQVGGARSGLLRTTNGGNTWTPITGTGAVVMTGKNISGVAPRGNTLLASVNTADSFTAANVGVFRSTNGGANFTQVSTGNGSATGLPGGVSYVLASDPTNPAILYTAMVFSASLGGGQVGVYKSTDTGASWTKVSNTAIDNFIDNGTSNPTGTSNIEISVGRSNNVYVAIINSGRVAAIFRSGDGGGSWAQMDTPVTNEGGVDIGLNPSGGKGPAPGSAPQLLAGGQGSIHSSLQADLTNANIVYIGGDRQPGPGEGGITNWPNSIGARDYSGRIFRGDASRAAGSQFVHLTHSRLLGPAGGGTASGSSPHADSRDMAWSANGVLLEVDDGGVYKRTNPQSNTGDWFSINGTIQTTEAHDAAYDSLSNTAITGNQDTGTTYQTSSTSATWRSLSTADGGDVSVDNITLAGSNQSIRYSSFQNLGAFRRSIWNSTGGLVSSTFPALTVTSGAGLSRQFRTPVILNAVDPRRMIIGGGNFPYQSTDSAATLVQLTGTGLGGVPSSGPIAYGGRRLGTPNLDVLYVGSGTGVFVRTGGGTTVTRSATYPGSTPRDIVMDPDDWMRAFVIDSNQVFFTSDAGATWTEITGNLSQNSLQSIEYVSTGTDRLVVSSDTGVFITDLGGTINWAAAGTGLPTVLAWDLDYDAGDDVLVVGTMGRGAWKLSGLASPVANNASFSTNEDLNLSGIVVATNSGNPLTYSVVTPPANGTLLSFNTNTGAFVYSPDPNYFNTFTPDTFTFQASNGTQNSNVATVSITVNPIADNPSVTNATTNEDVQTTSGLVISRDPVDGNEVTHFKITGITDGSLFQNNGTTPITNNSFITFAQANAGLKFTPSPNFFGVASFQVQASLNNTNGGLGGTPVTAFITVNPVPDTPGVTNATTVENTQTTSGLVISRNPVDGGGVTHFKITGISNGLLYQNNGTTPIVDGDFITFAQGNAGLKFTPNTGFIGTGSFQVQASLNNSDAGLGGPVVTATITVNAIADTPSVTNATTDEDVQTTSGLVITRNPADGVEVSHVRITGITNGTLFQNDGVTTITNGDFITFAQGGAGLKFTPSPNFFGTGSFNVQASINTTLGGLGGLQVTATITVNPVADTPGVTPSTADEDTQTISGLVISRNPVDSTEVTHFQITSVTNGLLFQNDGTTPIADGEFITFAQANAGLKFTPNAGFSGTGSFQVQSSLSNTAAGLGDAPATATITVNPIADTPSVTDATTDEDIQTTSGLVVSRNPDDTDEVSHFKITAITNGTLFQNDGTTPITAGEFITFDQANAGLKFTPSPNFFGTGSFNVQASVGNTDAGLGGLVVTATITVNPIADTPGVTPATTDEDTQTTSGLVISRHPADTTEVTHFKITAITNGTLFQNDGTTPIADGEFITFAQANAGLKFSPTAGFSGTGSFQVQASLSNTDAGLGGLLATGTITINPIADTPSVTNATTDEDVQTTDGLVISRNPADTNEVTHFKITAITNGTLFQNDGTTPITAGEFITFDQANAGLKFTPSPNFFGTGSFNVQASVGNTDAGLGGLVATATITVNPIADTPGVTPATTNEDTQSTSDLVISRHPADTTEVTHFKITAITNGVLFQNDGVTPIADGEFLTFAQANAGLKFTPIAGFSGTGSFQVQSSLSNTDAGLGGAPATAMITVNPVADTPSVTNSATREDIQTISGLVVSRNTSDSDEVTHFKITGVTNGSLFLNDGVTPIADGEFITFDQANAGLKFTPSPNFFGTGSFIVQGSVSNTDTGLGGNEVEATITVSPVADTPAVPTAATNEDTQTTGLVISRNSSDSAEVTHFKITGITNGSLFQNNGTTLIANNSFITFAQANAGLKFTPSPNFFGVASFQVQASLNNSDTGLGGAQATTTITVREANDVPIATADSSSPIAEDSGAKTILMADLLANDRTGPANEANQSLTIVGVGNAVGGSVSLSGTSVFFTLAPNFNGLASFVYTVADNGTTNGASDPRTATATVSFTVTPVNDTPIARDDAAAIIRAKTVQLNVLANDSIAPDTGETLTVVSVTQGVAGGKVTIQNGQVFYTRPAKYNGFDTFNYTISDGQMTATAQVTMTVGTPGQPAELVALGTDAGGTALVKLQDPLTRTVRYQIAPYPGYNGGVRVTTGDVNGDGVDDLITSSATGIGHVKYYDGITGAQIGSLLPFGSFASGLSLASADINSDGFDDIITGIVNGPAHVKAYNGRTGELLQSFIAYQGFMGGVRVGAGDLNGDDIADIVTVAGPGGNGHIRAFSGNNLAVLRSYLAYAGFQGEVTLTVANMRGGATIVTTAMNPTAGVHVRGANAQGEVFSFIAPRSFSGPTDDTVRGPLPSSFARIAAGDSNGDRIDELFITLGRSNTTTPTKVLTVDGATLGAIDILLAFDDRFRDGAFVG